MFPVKNMMIRILLLAGVIISFLGVHLMFGSNNRPGLEAPKKEIASNQDSQLLGAGATTTVDLPPGDKATAAQLDNILKTRKLSNTKGIGETDTLIGLVNKKKALNGGVMNLAGCFKANGDPQIDQCLINYIK